MASNRGSANGQPAEKDQAIIDAVVKRLREEMKANLDKVTARMSKIDELAEQVSNLESKVRDKLRETRATVEHIRKDLDALSNAAQAGPPPAIPKGNGERDLLSLDLRGVRIDPVALSALSELQAAMQVERKDVVDRIIKAGAGSSAKKLARALSTRRLPDMTTMILNTTLPQLLHEQYGSQIKPKDLDDTIGASSAILTRLGAADGMLKTFADLLVVKTGRQMNLAMSAAQAEQMSQRIYKSLI